MGIPDIPSSTAALLANLLKVSPSRTLGSGLGKAYRGFNSNSIRSALPLLGPIGNGLNNSLPRGASFGTAGNAGGTLGTLGASLANSLGSALGNRGQQQQQDPLMSLYDQLINQLSAPVNMPTGVNTEDLMKQVQNALNPIYDQRAQSAQRQGEQGQREVENMYRALANDYKEIAPQQKAQAQAAQQEIKQLYGQLRSNVEGNYSRVSENQSELFKQLGIEDALPSVLEDQAPAVTDALTAASQNQAAEESYYVNQGQTDQRYYNEGAPLATMRGNEIRTDMLSQLQDYLNQIEAERTSGIQSGYLDQLNQANGLLAQQQQTAQGEAGRRQEMLWQILQSQLKGNGNASPLDQFLSGLPSNVQRSVAESLTQLDRSPEAIYGKTRDPRNVSAPFVETTPQWYMAQADEMLKRGQITPEEHQALLMALQLKFAK